jgi:hypothetical protein
MAFFVKGEKIELKKDGTWVADGTEITHEQTRELFYRSIKWDGAEKKHYLEVGYERIFIEVEDTPFFVMAISNTKAGRSTPIATLSDGRKVTIEAPSLSYNNGALYLKLSDGQRAKFLSGPYYEFLKALEEDEKSYFVTIAGSRAILSEKTSQAPRPSASKRRR